MNPRFMCVFFRPNVITEVSALPLMFYFSKYILILFQSIILPKDNNVERMKCQENLMISQRFLLNHLPVVAWKNGIDGLIPKAKIETET